MAIRQATIQTVQLTGQTTFTVPFEYLMRKFVKLTLVNPTERKELVLGTDYRFTTKTTVQMLTAIDARFTKMEVRRVTSASEPVVSFIDGSVLRASSLNASTTQALHVAEEARDSVNIDGTGISPDGQLDARGRRIVNVANGVEDSDAITLGQVKGYDTSALNSAIRAEAAADRASGAVGDVITNLAQFSAVGDGVTDNAAAFQAADATGKDILVSKAGSYFTTYSPTARYYTNASAKIKKGTTEFRLSTVPQEIAVREQNEPDGNIVRLSNLAIGQDAGLTLQNTDTQYANTAIGTSALQNPVECTRSTAIGPYALKDVIKGYSVTAIGTTAGEWMNYGDRNLLVGDNSGKNLGNATPEERHILYVASKPDPMGWDVIWPEWRQYAGSVTSPAFKMTEALWKTKATHNVGVGRNALGFSISIKDSVAVGYDAVTYNLDGTDIVGVGDRVMQWTLKGTHITAVGSKSMQGTLDASQDTTLGYATLAKYRHTAQNIAIGYQALWGNAAVDTNKVTGNVAIGRITMANAVGDIEFNTAVGTGALAAVASNSNTAVGAGSLLRLTTGGLNTAVGRNSLIVMTAGTNVAALTNCTGVGANTRVSGDNQVQLGDSATTTYVYGTVQNRSDARDKTDVRNTKLGIEFIMGLRPVDGRWDMREDYYEVVQDGVDSEGNPLFRNVCLPRDGSKARMRRHQWFLAQEVQELCHKMRVEFGGLQDHKVRGGDDVMSLGYDEFIPPLTKAVQECWGRMDELEARIAKLESK